MTSKVRVACTMAPPGYFGERDYAASEELLLALRAQGFDVLPVSTLPFFKRDMREIDASICQLRDFEPSCVFGFPNAGYPLSCRMETSAASENVFTDVLKIPLVLAWDDPLGQFAGQLLGRLPKSPQESKPGAQQRIATSLENPLIRHVAWDSGHIDAVTALGWVARENVVLHSLPALEPYIAAGEEPYNPNDFDHDLAFFGNIYLDQLARDPLSGEQRLVKVAEQVAEQKIRCFSAPAWVLFNEAIADMSEVDRHEMKLDPDETFFWAAYRYVVWNYSLTKLRIAVLCGLRQPVAFYGAFADPGSVRVLKNMENIRYMGVLDYRTQMPQAFRRTRITIDITHTLAQRSAPGKFLECFAAGGFMLLDRRPDLIALFGPCVDKVMYGDLQELNHLIGYFLAHEDERRATADELREHIKREFRLSDWLVDLHGYASRECAV